MPDACLIDIASTFGRSAEPWVNCGQDRSSRHGHWNDLSIAFALLWQPQICRSWLYRRSVNRHLKTLSRSGPIRLCKLQGYVVTTGWHGKRVGEHAVSLALVKRRVCGVRDRCRCTDVATCEAAVRDPIVAIVSAYWSANVHQNRRECSPVATDLLLLSPFLWCPLGWLQSPAQPVLPTLRSALCTVRSPTVFQLVFTTTPLWYCCRQ